MIFWHESSATEPGGTARDGRVHEPGAANIPAMSVAGAAPLVSVSQAGRGRCGGSCDYGADRSALSGPAYYGSRPMAASLATQGHPAHPQPGPPPMQAVWPAASLPPPQTTQPAT